MRKWCLTVVLVFGTFCLLSTYGWAIIPGNGSGNGYTGDGTGNGRYTSESQTSGNQVIEDYVIEGAGHFLEAKIHIATFSNILELAKPEKPNFSEQQQAIADALVSIRAAKQTYLKLIDKANNTPYDWEMLVRLYYFDYEWFRRYYKLNREIFEPVVRYLSCGDITGYYKDTYTRFCHIENTILTIKGEVDANKLIDGPNIWHLNEYSAETLMAAQYVSRVFAALK